MSHQATKRHEMYAYMYCLVKELSLKKQHTPYGNQLYDILGKSNWGGEDNQMAEAQGT